MKDAFIEKKITLPGQYSFIKIRQDDTSERALSTVEYHLNVGHSLIVLSKRLKEVFKVKTSFRMSLRKHPQILWIPCYSVCQCFILVLLIRDPEEEGIISQEWGIKSYWFPRGLYSAPTLLPPRSWVASKEWDIGEHVSIFTEWHSPPWGVWESWGLVPSAPSTGSLFILTLMEKEASWNQSIKMEWLVSW